MDQSTALPILTSSGIPRIIFSWYDYALFSFMLFGSIMVGIYFGCFGDKQSTANEYLLGGKKMKVVPVALSMVASAISGLTILAVPADVYRFGATYWLSTFSVIAVSIFTYYIYLPVFYKLQLTSTYEYLKLRFDTRIRIIASVLFTISVLLYLPIVIYVPALAFAQATEINIHFVTPVLCGICIFYTTIGGLKAVVWTDTLQFSAMLGAMVAVFYIGLVNAGGFAEIWKVSSEGGRLDVDMDVNPLKKDTLWACVIGLSVNWIAHVGVSQGSVQKFLSLPTMEDCKKTTIIMAIGMILNKTFSVWVGLMIYTKYRNCDPVTSGRIEKDDQLIPYFIMDVAGHIPGLPGLFIAGVFCASLSTLSAVMNCLSGTVYEDFISRFMPHDISQKKVSNILKCIVIATGVIATSLVFLVETLGSLFPLAMSFGSVASGPLVGLFTLGMMCPSANAKGALVGSLTSLGFLSWIMIGSQYNKAKGVIKYVSKPVSVEGCTFPLNITTTVEPREHTDEAFFLFHITYYYYTLIGTLLVIIVGLIVSRFTKTDDKPVDRDLITPMMHWLLPADDTVNEEKSYYSIDKALNILTINGGDDKLNNFKCNKDDK